MSVSNVLRRDGSLSFQSSYWEVIKNNLYISEKWRYLVPIIGLLALGVILQPLNVPIGIAVGAANWAAQSVGALVVVYAHNKCRTEERGVSENRVSYIKVSLEDAYWTVLILPIVEEGIFRGLLQPLLGYGIKSLVPLASAPFLGTGLSIAVSVSVVASSLIFGLAHLSNKIGYLPPILATVSGVVYGVLAARLSLSASIASHVVNNTLAVTVLTWSSEVKA